MSLVFARSPWGTVARITSRIILHLSRTEVILRKKYFFSLDTLYLAGEQAPEVDNIINKTCSAYGV